MSQNAEWVPRPNGETAQPPPSASPPGPLNGVRILELAQNLAGPYCGQILAGLGADVIKVEPPGGDAARAWGPPFVDGAGSIFAAANRGKRSIELDLHLEQDVTALRALIEQSDILIEAFRPGTFAAMGFDHDTVRGWNPALIYCSVLAYGEEGPLHGLPGYDPLMQAHGGLMSITGEPGTRGARVGTSVIDMGTGMWLVIAIMAALRKRDASGTGTRLSVSLYDTALAWSSYHIGGFIDTGAVPHPMGSELPMIAPYGAFDTTDGHIMIAAGNDGIFARLCDALSLSDLRTDARFGTNASRVAHRSAVNAAVRSRVGTFTTADLLGLLRRTGVPCAPIQDIAEVSADPQTIASGMIASGHGPTAVKMPIRFDGVRPVEGTPPPRAGEHTAAILAELGLD
ncbi:MAG TPA: CoA transferase [Longimicrobiales bacterium]|nr:CoA transferase [Longimicrobiales bacterium]